MGVDGAYMVPLSPSTGPKQLCSSTFRMNLFQASQSATKQPSSAGAYGILYSVTLLRPLLA